MKININLNLYCNNTYKLENTNQLIKLELKVVGTQIVIHDDGSFESADEQPSAAVIENGNVTVIVMNVTNDTNIEPGSNNASKQSQYI